MATDKFSPVLGARSDHVRVESSSCCLLRRGSFCEFRSMTRDSRSLIGNRILKSGDGVEESFFLAGGHMDFMGISRRLQN